VPENLSALKLLLSGNEMLFNTRVGDKRVGGERGSLYNEKQYDLNAHIAPTDAAGKIHKS
jgi:hypothetical protein